MGGNSEKTTENRGCRGKDHQIRELLQVILEIIPGVLLIIKLISRLRKP